MAPAALLISYLGWQEYQLEQTTEARMQALQATPMTILSFTREAAKQLKWEHEKEFEYQGEMYDVVKTSVVGDSIYYECWKDQEESQIKRRIYNLVAQDHSHLPQQRDGASRLLIFLQSLFYYQNKSLLTQALARGYLLANHTDSHYYFLNDERPPNPPPEI